MNGTPPLYKSDIKPQEFVFAVAIGSIGSAALSWLHVPGLVSVLFALLVMGVLALLRWRIARQFKDYQSLEAFAEDIYLLGYLLTLAALLGLAPRLMSEDTNLFNIAGIKLITTVAGLALMMIFRQTARRWAEEKEGEETEKFEEDQRRFGEAVARLNQGADALTSKLDEVVHWFDPKLLEPLAEWSNRAAGAFSLATTKLEAVPESIRTGLQQLRILSDELGRVTGAAGDLAGVLGTGTAQAANVLTNELGKATQAASGFEARMTTLAPAGDAARGAIEKLGGQATQGSTELVSLGEGFRRTALELGKVERALKKLVDLDTKDVNAPMNRLAEALESSSKATADAGERINALAGAVDKSVATTITSAAGMESLKGSLESAASAGKALEGYQQALQGVRTQFALAVERIAGLDKQMEGMVTKAQARNGFEKELLEQLGGLQRAMGETNAQLKGLAARVEAAAGGRLRSGGLLGLFRGGS